MKNLTMRTGGCEYGKTLFAHVRHLEPETLTRTNANTESRVGRILEENQIERCFFRTAARLGASSPYIRIPSAIPDLLHYPFCSLLMLNSFCAYSKFKLSDTLRKLSDTFGKLSDTFSKLSDIISYLPAACQVGILPVRFARAAEDVGPYQAPQGNGGRVMTVGPDVLGRPLATFATLGDILTFIIIKSQIQSVIVFLKCFVMFQV